MRVANGGRLPVATEQSFVEFVVDQIDNDCNITWKKMFGEYGVWSSGKIVALICDHQFFLKPTEAGRAYLGQVVEAPAYPGAKPSFLIDELEDREWLSELIRVTAAELPEPKKKSKKQPAKKLKE